MTATTAARRAIAAKPESILDDLSKTLQTSINDKDAPQSFDFGPINVRLSVIRGRGRAFAPSIYASVNDGPEIPFGPSVYAAAAFVTGALVGGA